MKYSWSLTGQFGTPVEGKDAERYLYTPIHARADGLVMGLFLAHLEVFAGDRSKRGLAGSAWPVLAAACIFLLFRKSAGGAFNYTCYALVFGSCTWFLLTPRAWLTVLDSRAFYVLSRLSFGSYLNHFYLHHPLAGLALRLLPFAEQSPLLHQLASFGFFVAASAAVAVLTFCLIESPFLRLREWLFSKWPHNQTNDHAPALERQPG